MSQLRTSQTPAHAQARACHVNWLCLYLSGPFQIKSYLQQSADNLANTCTCARACHVNWLFLYLFGPFQIKSYLQKSADNLANTCTCARACHVNWLFLYLCVFFSRMIGNNAQGSSSHFVTCSKVKKQEDTRKSLVLKDLGV